MAVKPIPEGMHAVTPYITVPGVAKLIEFLERTFDAKVVHQPTKRPDGTIMHAEVKIGDSLIMMGEPIGTFTAMPASLYVYVTDTDAAYQRGLKAGGKSLMEPANQFYGDRNAGVEDPTGNRWWIATHIEDVAPEELARRSEAALKQQHA